MAYQIQLRRDTAANWTSEDTVLAEGEIGLETDTGKIKIGDGVTAWTGLAYFAGAAGGGDFMADGSVPLTGDIDFAGTQQCHDLQAPAAAGEAIRQTAKITEAALETAVDSCPNRRYVSCFLNGSLVLTTSDVAYFRIPSAFTGMNLVSVGASVGTGVAGSSSSGTPTFTIRNVTDNHQMLSTSLTVDQGEYTSATAATPVVIDAGEDDVVTDDLIEVKCTVAGTGVTYTCVTLGFQLP